MNQETQKQALLKVVLVSGVACMAWIFLVKPAFENVQDQKQTVASHESLIVSYKEKIGSFDSGESLIVQNQLEGILDTMSGTIGKGDSGTALHALINESASKNGVSVSRIESINARELTQKIEGSEYEVNGINHIIRIELEGDYGSVISFMDEVVSGPMQVKFVGFRFIPIGHESVRFNAEINSVVLTSVPTGSDLGDSIDE